MKDKELKDKKSLKFRFLFIAGMIRWISEGNSFGLERVEYRIDETCRKLYDEAREGYWTGVTDHDTNVEITNTLRIICECRLNEIFDRINRETKSPLWKGYIDGRTEMQVFEALASLKRSLAHTNRMDIAESVDFSRSFDAFSEFFRPYYQEVGNARFGRGKYCGQLTYYHEVDYRLNDIIDNDELEPHHLELLLYLTAKRILKA